MNWLMRLGRACRLGYEAVQGKVIPLACRVSDVGHSCHSTHSLRTSEKTTALSWPLAMIIPPWMRSAGFTAARLLTANPSLRVLFDQTTIEASLRRLLASELLINTVYDVGCHRGAWTQELRPLLPQARYCLFDPLDYAARLAVDPRITFFQALLSDHSGPVPFHSTGGTGDSCFQEATPFYAGLEPRLLQAERLDALVRQHHLPPPDFLKVDTQGAELQVLRGAGELLKRCALIQLECSLVAYNVGAPLIGDCIEQLRQWGFLVVAIQPITWTGGRSSALGTPADAWIPQADLLFASQNRLDTERFASCLNT